MGNAIFQTLLCASTAALPGIFWISQYGASRQAIGVTLLLAMIGGGVGLSAASAGVSLGSTLRRVFKGFLYSIVLKNASFLADNWNPARNEPDFRERRSDNERRITGRDLERICTPLVKVTIVLGAIGGILLGILLTAHEPNPKPQSLQILSLPIFGFVGALVLSLYACTIRYLFVPGPHRREILGGLAFGFVVGSLMSYAVGIDPASGNTELSQAVVFGSVIATFSLFVSIPISLIARPDDDQG